MIARSTLWGTIQTGKGFAKLTEREQRAVIAHEQGHLHHRHAWKRLAWILTLRATLDGSGFLAMCEAQELEADRYSAERGHTPGLVSFLFRHSLHVKSDGYPTPSERLEALCVRRV